MKSAVWVDTGSIWANILARHLLDLKAEAPSECHVMYHMPYEAQCASARVWVSETSYL